MIKKVIWTSMIDYPERTATVMFVGNCNFNCSYCYNRTLTKEKDIDFEKEILPKLISRKDFISHVIISGGEPTTDVDFGEILEKLNNNGFVVGIHTNGSNPELIKRNIGKIEFLGIDIKTSREKYNDITGATVDFEKIKQTVKIAVDNNKKIEIRTTLFPKYVTMDDCLNIARIIKGLGVKEYQLQQFYAVNGAEEVGSYCQEDLENIQKECNKILPTTLKTK